MKDTKYKKEYDGILQDFIIYRSPLYVFKTFSLSNYIEDRYYYRRDELYNEDKEYSKLFIETVNDILIKIKQFSCIYKQQDDEDKYYKKENVNYKPKNKYKKFILNIEIMTYKKCL